MWLTVPLLPYPAALCAPMDNHNSPSIVSTAIAPCSPAAPLSSPVSPTAGETPSPAVPVVQPPRSDKPEEACGVFGLYAPEEDVAKLTYFGLFALQHRGQESAGIATLQGDRLQIHKHMGLVSQVFSEEILASLKGDIAIGHTRYSTTGSSHVGNAQPAIVGTRLGSLALAHNGNLVNVMDLKRELEANNHNLVTTTDSEMIALAIGEAVDEGLDWIPATVQALNRCQGAFSLVIGTPQGIIGTRDPQGIRPLVIGSLQYEDNTPTRYVLASETCALDIIGADFVRSVKPGELIWITEDKFESFQWAEQVDPKLCVFEMIYFSRPDSCYEGESLYSYRQRLGKVLAQESPIEADLVMGVPDSGIPAAIGFSEVSGIPYAEGLIKNRYVGRTFIQPTQHMREVGIRMKLNPLRDVLKGKRVVIVDDSIVRGTTSRKLVQALREAGATEVHMRISSPPVTHPCFYGIDTDSQDQLIAATQSVAQIAAKIGVDSLSYLTVEGMVNTTLDDPSHFCTACFTGSYPVPVPDAMKRSKLMLETVANS